jgi:hypothetical protein
MAPPLFLQLLGLAVVTYAQCISARLQHGVHFAYSAPPFADSGLVFALFRILEHVYWARAQLHQLVLPGDSAKAAAALQDLQEQQQQLQQALTAALWCLHRAAEIMRAYDTEQQQQQQQQQQQLHHQEDEAHSSSRKTQLCDPACAAELAGLASCQPTEQLDLAAVDLAGRNSDCTFALSAAQAASLLGSELPQQLQQFGSALWSALPQPRCCNNAACANLGSVSEAKLVAGKASRCSKCKVAK